MAVQRQMIVYGTRMGQISKTNASNNARLGQQDVQSAPRRNDAFVFGLNEDPLVDMRVFYFSEANSLIFKRIEVSRVHIPDWDDGELMLMLMEKRVWAFFSRNPLYFSFLKVKANVYDSSFFKRSNTLKTILFFRVSKGCFMTVTMYERSSNHLRKTK